MVPLKWLTLALLAAISNFLSNPAIAVTLSSPNFQALTNAIASSTNVQLNFDGVISFPSAINITGSIAINGGNHSVTFDGGGATRFFCITNGGDLTLSSITLTRGSSPNREPGSSGYGGAILVTNGSLTMNKCTVTGNMAQGIQGFLTLQTTQYNYVPILLGYTSTNSGSGLGGAIYATAGRLRLNDCVFKNNSTRGPDGLFRTFSAGFETTGFATSPGNGSGGAIVATRCDIDIERCLFQNNSVFSGHGYVPFGSFGDFFFYQSRAIGGALTVSGNLTIRDSSFVQNTIDGGWESGGGALYQDDGNIYAENTGFVSNTAPGLGGALNLGATGILQRCSFLQNAAISKEPRLPAGGGAILHTTPLAVIGSVFTSNRTVGGDYRFPKTFGDPGTPPSPGRGGGILSQAPLHATNCVFFGNSARSGAGGALSPPAGGAAIAISDERFDSEGYFVHCSFASNILESAAYADPSRPLQGSAIWTHGTATLLACALSKPDTVPLVAGTNLIDGGFNVVADSSLPLTQSSSLNNTDPLLQFLPDAGFSILRPAPGSRAIDRVTVHLADYDIRGMLRPQTGSDSGAVELAAETPLMITPAYGSFTISAPKFTERLRLLGSADLKSWSLVGPTNTSSFTIPASSPYHFFKVQFDP